MGWFSSTPAQAPESSTSGSASASSSQPTQGSAPAPTPAQLPPDHPPVPAGADKCPVDESARSVWLQASETAEHKHPMKSAAGGGAGAASESSAGTSAEGYKLGTAREVSSIPRSAKAEYAHKEEQAALPAQGEEETGNWVYPSEQQFFNAMMRKNHNPRARDMRTIVPIHNAVNERAWEEILMWEAGKGGDRCGGIRLSSFVGRPKDRSPKAWVKSVFGYTPPFDRHDWIVDRCGTQVRYVIDFYTGKPDPSRPGAPSFYLDVRPALDDWEHVKTRASRFWG